MSRRTEQRKWGIRTLLFLGLAGAVVCTIRGIRAWGGHIPRETPPRGPGA